MTKLVDYFYREPRLVILCVVLTIVGGLSALWSLGRQEDPTLTNRYASIVTEYPGAEPSIVEALVTAAIEDQIKLISDIDTYSSNSLRGVSSINVAVKDDLSAVEIDQVWSDLRTAALRAQVQFPPGAAPPRIDTEGITAYTTVVAVEIADDSVALNVAARVARRLERDLRAIPLTRAVDLFGQPQEEIAVILDPSSALASASPVGRIAEAIIASNDPALAGRLAGAGVEFNLVMSERLSSVSDLREVPLPAGTTDFIPRLGDVAEIRRQLSEPQSSVAFSQGRRAILVAAVLDDGAQVDRWMRLVREDVEKLSRDLPQGLRVSVLFDQSSYTTDRLLDVGLNLLIGVGLVFAVLTVTLGLRAAAVVGMMLPMVSLATLASFMFLGLPLHQMSLTGLIVALGLVVDASIVTTDTVRRKLDAGEPRAVAVRLATDRVLLPLAASTVTTILTFLPMIMLSGDVGDFVRTIAIAVSIMLVWSFVLTLILVGPLSALLLPRRDPVPNKTGGRKGVLFRLLRFAMNWPLLSITIAAVGPVVGFVLFLGVPSQFFPLAERNQFHLSVTLPNHVGIGRTEDLVTRVDAYLDGIEGITGRYWVAGGSAPAFYYNIVSQNTNNPSYGQAMVTTDTPARAREILATLQQDLRQRFPEARVSVQVLSQGPPVNAPIAFLIYGPELSELRRIGAEAQQAIAALPEASQVIGGLTNGLPQLRFDVDEVASQFLGLDPASLAAQIRAGMVGADAGFLMEAGTRLPIRVKFPEDVRSNPEALLDLPIKLPFPAANGAAQTVPLSTLAQPRLEVIEPLIYRFSGERMNYILAYPHSDVLPATLFEKAKAEMDRITETLPAGYRIELSGAAEGRSATVDSLASQAPLIAVLAIATLVLTFQSFRLTLGTLIVALMSTGLSLFSVAIMGYPFGINALIGVIGSVGVSVNASIIIFTALRDNPMAAAGDVDAATQEVLDGARHIISTTLTTFGGFLPLMLGGGLFWPPFATAVAGGVLLSSGLAFLFAPAWFKLFHPEKRFELRLIHLSKQKTLSGPWPASQKSLPINPFRAPPENPRTRSLFRSRHRRDLRRNQLSA